MTTAADQRWILHADMDAFFASVEQRDFPELVGKPVAVGGHGARSVVSAASYEARQFGVRSAMPMREALRRCPDLCVQPGRMASYQEASRRVFEEFHKITPEVEGLSIDEAFLDITHSINLLGDPARIGLTLKKAVLDATGLKISVGIAPNKLVAKIASDLNKPDGFTMISPADLPAALDQLPAKVLPGIGPRKLPQLEAAGIRTLGQLRRASDATLDRLFGRYAQRVRDRATGVDDRAVGSGHRERSISAESTFSEDIRDKHDIQAELSKLCDKVAARVRRKQWVAATLAVKIRRSDFRTYARQTPLKPASAETQRFYQAALRLTERWREANPDSPIRLLGVAARDLNQRSQGDLFGGPGEDESEIDTAVDAIREKFGSAVVGRARSVKHEPER